MRSLCCSISDAMKRVIRDNGRVELFRHDARVQLWRNSVHPLKREKGKTLPSCRSGSRTEEFSPRCVLEKHLSGVESDTDSSNATTSDSDSRPSVGITHWRNVLRVWKQRSMRRLATFPPVGVPKLSRKSSVRSSGDCFIDAELCLLKPSWRNFTLAELKSATNNFSPENLIGRGGYAEVYRGTLAGGELIAVKKLIKGTNEERIGDFLSELGIIAHINHKNAARLLGFSVEGGMHLVLQLSHHGSLASLLYGPKEQLNWEIRYKIALGTAEGLLYLHKGCQRRIIHRDIKASNILLAVDFEPQISDFGLAKWLPDKWTHHTVSRFEGTFGYLAPEYFMHGIVDEKTDVFAFGVLLLELISGRRPIDSSKKSLVMWAKPLLDANNIKDLVDPTLGDSYDSKQMNCMVLTASMCIQQAGGLRPTMSQVLHLLRGEDDTFDISRPVRHRAYSEEMFDVGDYDATMYSNDMNRHRQLALEF